MHRKKRDILLTHDIQKNENVKNREYNYTTMLQFLKKCNKKSEILPKEV